MHDYLWSPMLQEIFLQHLPVNTFVDYTLNVFELHLQHHLQKSSLIDIINGKLFVDSLQSQARQVPNFKLEAKCAQSMLKSALLIVRKYLQIKIELFIH